MLTNWSLLGGNYFKLSATDNSHEKNLVICSKAERSSLTKVFCISSEEMDRLKESKISTVFLTVAAISANRRFSKAYNAAGIITKIFWFIMSLLGFGLLASFDRFTNKLAIKTAENFKGNLRELIDKKMLSNNAYEVQFLEKVAQVCMRTIENSNANKGFVFTVTNSKGVISYLIGATHAATYKMTKNKEVQDIILNSSELITEVGNCEEAKALYKLGENKGGFFNPFKYSTDGALMRFAESNGITISALETIAEQKKAWDITVKSMKLNPLPVDLEKKIVAHSPYGNHEIAELWQEGNEDKLIPICTCTHPLLTLIMNNGRTKEWSVSLVKKLQTTTKTTTIVVGTAHCLGKNGLAAIFIDAGLTVERKKNQ